MVGFLRATYGYKVIGESVFLLLLLFAVVVALAVAICYLILLYIFVKFSSVCFMVLRYNFYFPLFSFFFVFLLSEIGTTN